MHTSKFVGSAEALTRRTLKVPPDTQGLSSSLSKGFKPAEFTKRAANFQMCDHGGRFSSQALRIIVSLHTSTPPFLVQLTAR